MTPGHALLLLRLVEVIVLGVAVWWIIWTQDPCTYRNKRLAFASILFAINVAAIGVCVLWLKATPW